MPLKPKPPIGKRPDSLQAYGVSGLVRRWARLWHLKGLDCRVRIEWSSRLRHSLGRAYPGRRTVKLSLDLAGAPTSLLAEVLCHEVAHVAVGDVFSGVCRPHGPEWASLVRAAGFEPRTRLHLENIRRRAPLAAKSVPLYAHRCPVCHARRLSRRPMRRWRCAECVAAGLEGRLEISRLTRRATA